MSLARFDYMAQLYRQPEGLRMRDLSRRLMVTGGNVTGLTDELERDGLVLREASPTDRRAWIVRLTPQGRSSFEAMARSTSPGSSSSSAASRPGHAPAPHPSGRTARAARPRRRQRGPAMNDAADRIDPALPPATASRCRLRAAAFPVGGGRRRRPPSR